MRNCASRHQFYRSYSRENLGYFHARRGGVARLRALSISRRLRRRRGYRTDLWVWLSFSQRRNQGRGKGALRRVHGRANFGKRRDFRRGDILLFNGNDFPFQKQEKLKESRPLLRAAFKG